jgi:hypothetical protein
MHTQNLAIIAFTAWKTLTFVAALRCEGMTAPMLIKGAMKGEGFWCHPALFAAACGRACGISNRTSGVPVSNSLRFLEKGLLGEHPGVRCLERIPVRLDDRHERRS